jgi:hypothetical protein
MENLSEILIKSFTRYFIPGLILLFVAFYIPLYFFSDTKIFQNLKLLELPVILVFSVILGYLLDSIGAYRLTLSYKEYKRAREELVLQAYTLNPSIRSNDPDKYLGDLWLLNEQLYNRLFIERAEFVMILETSVALFIGAVIIILFSGITFLKESQFKCSSVLIALVLLTGAYISSVKGVQRMRVHNTKMLRAIKHVTEEFKHTN